MPRYFLHVHADLVAYDEEGLELPDIEAAKAEAIAGARALICDDVEHGRLALNHRIDVEDEAGNRVAEIVFRDVIAIEG